MNKNRHIEKKINKSDEFLRILYVQNSENMRARSSWEHSILNLHAGLSPILVAGFITGLDKLNELGDKTLFTVGIAIILYLIALAIVTHVKIHSLHKVYEKIGNDNVKILEYFGAFEKGAYLPEDSIMSEEAKNMGKGIGYIFSLVIVWTVTILLVVVVLVIILSKLCQPCQT